MYALIRNKIVKTKKMAISILNEIVSMNNKWEKDCYFWVLAYMLVQTIQSEFEDGTEDIIKTLKWMFDYPIQPVKRSYIQSWFTYEKDDAYSLSVLKNNHPNLTSTIKPSK